MTKPVDMVSAFSKGIGKFTLTFQAVGCFYLKFALELLNDFNCLDSFDQNDYIHYCLV